MKKTSLILCMLFVILNLKAQTSLISHWRFNNSSHDVTGNYDATLLGGTTYSPSALERSHSLNVDPPPAAGSDYGAECGTINLGEIFSISGWYKVYGSGSGLRTIFSRKRSITL